MHNHIHPVTLTTFCRLEAVRSHSHEEEGSHKGMHTTVGDHGLHLRFYPLQQVHKILGYYDKCIEESRRGRPCQPQQSFL